MKTNSPSTAERQKQSPISAVLKTLLGERGVNALRPAVQFLRTMRAESQIALSRNWEHIAAECRWRILQLAKSSLPAARPKREKPHVLFVTEKWCECNPEMGVTNSEHNLFGSLATSGLATQVRFHFDEHALLHDSSVDAGLLRVCLREQPDLLVLSWLPPGPTPQKATLELLVRKIGIPIVAIWWDSVWPQKMEVAESFLPFVARNIVVDSMTAYRTVTRRPEKYLPLWTPQDARVFHNPQLVRDMDLSFVGSVNYYPDRQAGLEALRRAGMTVFQAGGQREKRLSADEYARVHMRSKIGLNFSASAGSRFMQAKGRVFEITLCGAMLLESENAETAKWFEPMVDYVPFTDPADLVDKARCYLAHPVERERIAANGHAKAKECYTGTTFWKKVFVEVLGRNLAATA